MKSTSGIMWGRCKAINPQLPCYDYELRVNYKNGRQPSYIIRTGVQELPFFSGDTLIVGGQWYIEVDSIEYKYKTSYYHTPANNPYV